MSSYFNNILSNTGDLKTLVLASITTANKYNLGKGKQPSAAENIRILKEVITMPVKDLENASYSKSIVNSDTFSAMSNDASNYAANKFKKGLNSAFTPKEKVVLTTAAPTASAAPTAAPTTAPVTTAAPVTAKAKGGKLRRKRTRKLRRKTRGSRK